MGIRRFGDAPLLLLGTTDIAFGDQDHPASEVLAFSGFHLILDGAEPAAVTACRSRRSVAAALPGREQPTEMLPRRVPRQRSRYAMAGGM